MMMLLTNTWATCSPVDSQGGNGYGWNEPFLVTKDFSCLEVEEGEMLLRGHQKQNIVVLLFWREKIKMRNCFGLCFFFFFLIKRIDCSMLSSTRLWFVRSAPRLCRAVGSYWYLRVPDTPQKDYRRLQTTDYSRERRGEAGGSFPRGRPVSAQLSGNVSASLGSGSLVTVPGVRPGGWTGRCGQRCPSSPGTGAVLFWYFLVPWEPPASCWYRPAMGRVSQARLKSSKGCMRWEWSVGKF